MSAPWESIDAFLTRMGITFGAPTIPSTTGGSHVANSYHYRGEARDYGVGDSDVDAITAALLPYASGPDAPIAELFSSRDNVFMKDGAKLDPDPQLRADHYDHVHVALRDGATLDATTTPTATNAAVVTTGSGGGGGWLSSVASSIARLVLEGTLVAAGIALVVLGAKRGVAAKTEGAPA